METLHSFQSSCLCGMKASFINRGLGAVLARDYPRDRMEIIVADGLSDDGTRKLSRLRAVRERGGGCALGGVGLCKNRQHYFAQY